MRMGDSLDPGASSTCKKTCIKSDLAMMLDSSSEDEGEGEPDNSSADAFLRKELLIYRIKKRQDLDENPLNWWKVNRCEFKILSKLACRYLSPPPANVPSEQLFSGAGLIYNSLRNRRGTGTTFCPDWIYPGVLQCIFLNLPNTFGAFFV
ncbi:hypothetical protein EVAR_19886_1 [Eumeta japonica]|uniref:HAT C-terminal dimerisation domain-containing protein n=1 Tax=Eumeta variegata TaxID=151549 RepID=A0A4C1XPD0_EUMVA|nr:hypothetical protein EVAR_19886_1 [Eumeta japonica]